jgi:hypothetical protein
MDEYVERHYKHTEQCLKVHELKVCSDVFKCPTLTNLSSDIYLILPHD